MMRDQACLIIQSIDALNFMASIAFSASSFIFSANGTTECLRVYLFYLNKKDIMHGFLYLLLQKSKARTGILAQTRWIVRTRELICAFNMYFVYLFRWIKLLTLGYEFMLFSPISLWEELLALCLTFQASIFIPKFCLIPYLFYLILNILCRIQVNIMYNHAQTVASLANCVILLCFFMLT